MSLAPATLSQRKPRLRCEGEDLPLWSAARGGGRDVKRFITQVEGFKPNVIVHAGASLAQELERYEALGARHVVWIEAVPAVAEQMRDRVAERSSGRTTHTCVQAVITDRDGDDIIFNHFNNFDASSSIFRGTEVLHDKWPKLRETGETSVLKSSRLDTLLGGLGVRPEDVDVLILDIQGAELLGLKGAGVYLDHAAFLEVECSVEPIYEGGALFGEVNALVESKGFARLSETPWHGDVVYVRSGLLDEDRFAALRLIAEQRRAESQGAA